MREELLQRLRHARITTVIAHYSGSGDEGFIDEITFTPHEPEEAMRRDLDDFFWEEVIDQNSQHSGFHNGDGGYGKITWQIKTDKMMMHHRSYIMDVFDHGQEEITS